VDYCWQLLIYHIFKLWVSRKATVSIRAQAGRPGLPVPIHQTAPPYLADDLTNFTSCTTSRPFGLSAMFRRRRLSDAPDGNQFSRLRNIATERHVSAISDCFQEVPKDLSL